ncbi:MAG: DUF927 domain-containing protein, partial [Alcaligenaceae bacterium]
MILPARSCRKAEHLNVIRIRRCKALNKGLIMNTNASYDSLPHQIKSIHRQVDENGILTGKVIVGILDKARDVAVYELVDALQLNQAHGVFAQIAAKYQLVDDLKDITRLGNAIYQHATKYAYLAYLSGYHRVLTGDSAREFFVWNSVPYSIKGTLTDEPLIIAAESKSYRVNGRLEDWKDAIGNRLIEHDSLLVTLCAALQSLLTTWLALPRVTLGLIGPTSRGKNSVQLAISSMLGKPKVQSASGTVKGVDAYLREVRDQPALLDELRQTESTSGLVSLIFDLANGARRITSTTDGTARLTSPHSGSLIASNEVGLLEMAKSARIRLDEGIVPRYFEISVDELTGLFNKLENSSDARNYA